MIDVDRLRNVAIVSRSSAGKTALTEALLFNGGVISRLGRVDDGTTKSDFSPDEIERKISISLALLHVNWDGYKINIIDAPGYLDFVGEIKRSLFVADACILVMDGTSEGVEAGTEVVWRFADERDLPRAIFVNKMDKDNANFFKTINDIKANYKNVLPIQLPIGQEREFKGIVDVLSRKAYTFSNGELSEVPVPNEMQETLEENREKLIEAIAETDDSLTEKYLEDEELTEEEIKKGLRTGIITGKIVPVLCGSAYQNIGIRPLLDLIVTSFPSPSDQPPKIGKDPKTGEDVECVASPDLPLSAQAFKVITDPFIGELTLIKVQSGVLRSGDEVYNSNKGKSERIGHICVLQGKERREVGEISAGDIGALVKIKGISTSETLCDSTRPVCFPAIEFPTPITYDAINPKTKTDQEKMSSALAKLQDEDPTFQVRLEHELKQTIISGMGELHLDVMLGRLAREFGVEVKLEKPKIPYRETITSKSKGEGKYKKQSGGRGQYGHCFIEIEPLPRGDGFQFENKIFGGAIPSKYIPAVEKGIRDAMDRGILAGYPIVDIRVTLYDGTFHTVDSSDLAFQIAGSFALKQAFERASPVLLEPIMDVRVTTPKEYMGDICGDLNGRRGKIQGMDSAGHVQVIRALVPQSEMYKYSNVLKSITSAKGVFEMSFSHYETVPFHLQERIIEERKKEKEE